MKFRANKPVDGCFVCGKCGVKMHTDYFITRKNRPNGAGYYLDCRACRREDWRLRARMRRKESRDYHKPYTLTDKPEVIAHHILELTGWVKPEDSGVIVYRLTDGAIQFRIGTNFLPPSGAELIGTYDFDATKERIIEDLTA